MKKLLGIVVLGLLLYGNAFAEEEISKKKIEELGEIIKFDISYYPESMHKIFNLYKKYKFAKK